VRRIRLVLAESYANNCFAEVLIEALGLNLNPFHTSKLSREKVLRKALKALEMLSDDEAELIVIDHERAPFARKWVDENFEKEAVYEDKMYVGVFKRDERLTAVIFDPDIEEFLCRAVDRRYCREEEGKALKRGSSYRTFKELRELIRARREIINDVVSALYKRLGL
jgi:hypothetical protein